MKKLIDLPKKYFRNRHEMRRRLPYRPPMESDFEAYNLVDIIIKGFFSVLISACILALASYAIILVVNYPQGLPGMIADFMVSVCIPAGDCTYTMIWPTFIIGVLVATFIAVSFLWILRLSVTRNTDFEDYILKKLATIDTRLYALTALNHSELLSQIEAILDSDHSEKTRLAKIYDLVTNRGDEKAADE